MAGREEFEHFLHEATYKSALKYARENPDKRVSIVEKREVKNCWACKNGIKDITFTDSLDLKYDLTKIFYCPICGRKI